MDLQLPRVAQDDALIACFDEVKPSRHNLSPQRGNATAVLVHA
jgi:hypothetical protein